jgi:hypothetical protein
MKDVLKETVVFSGTIMAFVCRGWRKPRTFSVKIADIRGRDLNPGPSDYKAGSRITPSPCSIISNEKYKWSDSSLCNVLYFRDITTVVRTVKTTTKITAESCTDDLPQHSYEWQSALAVSPARQLKKHPSWPPRHLPPTVISWWDPLHSYSVICCRLVSWNISPAVDTRYHLCEAAHMSLDSCILLVSKTLTDLPAGRLNRTLYA